MVADRADAAGQGWRPWADGGGQPLVRGRFKSVRKRFTRWSRAGVWERVFGELSRNRDNAYLMIDSAIVRAHAQAATGQKGGAKTRLWAEPPKVPAMRSIVGKSVEAVPEEG